MSNYSVLKQDINNNIYENQTQQITGTVLNAILNEMTASLGAGYQFAGVATLGMNPGDPDQRVFYLAGEGIYTNFGGLQVPQGKLGVLKWDFRWTLQTIDGLGGGGANLTGYVSLASTDDLPEEGQPTLGYLCGTNLYLYVGTGGDTKDGKYQNCGSFRGPQGLQGDPGVGIATVTQTTTSTEDEGINVITVTKEDGTQSTFQVRNGSKGSQGIQGPQGVQGEPGRLQAQYKEVETLPTASADTVDYIYLVASQTPNTYDMYYTEENQGAYSWKSLGTTAVQLSDYATKAEVNQLEAKVDDEIGVIYNEVFGVSITQPTENDKVNGYVSSGGILVPDANYCVFVDVSKLNGLHITQLTTTPGDQYAFLKSKTGNQCEFVDGTGRIDAQLNHTLVPDGAVLLYILLGSHNTDPVPVLSIDEGETKPIREELEEKQDVIVDEETRQLTFSKDSPLLEYVGNYYQQGDGALIAAPSMHLYQFVAEDDIDLWWVSQTSGNDVILAIYLNGVATTANFIAPRMRNDGNTNTLPTSENKLHVAKGRLVTISYYTGDFVFAYTYAQKIFKPGILLSEEQVAQAQGGEIGKISVTVNSDYYGITMNGYDIRLIHYVNAGRNADCWTINEINKNGSVVLPSGTDVVGVLKEKNQDNFMGGYAHGNEQIVDFHILADGNAITENVNCNTVDVFMYSHLYRVSNPSENIIDRYTHINFKDGCITIETTFKCLVDNFQLDIAYNGGMWAWRQGLAQFATTNIGLLNASGSSGVSVFGTKHELISASALLGTGLVSAENILGFEQEKFKGEAYYYGNEGDTARMKIYFSTDDNSVWGNGHLCVGRAKYTMV